ncbi:MAG TPA: SseB family protein [Pirellulaceae bacterium]|nr:SseB family protein [Pirellulaceae bacterium]
MPLTDEWLSDAIEAAALTHIRERSNSSLQGLYRALVSGRLLVPLFSDLTTHEGKTDVPVRCFRLPSGEGCIPAFTSVQRLLEWDPGGSLYAEMPCQKLFVMATGMLDIDAIFVNYSHEKGVPKGMITRPEFELLAQGVFPKNG